MPPRGKVTQLTHMYAADFETCDTDQLYKVEPNGQEIYFQRVWLAGLKNLATLETTYFTDIADFMKFVLRRGDNQNTEYAFHNLKFDGSFIVPWLLNNGYQVTTKRPEKGQFSVLIDERNAWYSITIQVTGKRKVTMWDNLKLFPCSLEYLPNEYGTPARKKQEDQDFYERKRPPGHTPTEEELEYLENDLQVMAETLRAHIDFYGLRFKKTQAGQAFYDFEQTFKAWKFRFPPLSLELDLEIRKSYWGGLAHVAERHKGKDCYNVAVYDINSSYPYQLANRKMPYGPMIKRYDDGRHPDMSKFWIAAALVKFTLKPDKVPCIPTKSITEGKPITLEHWLSDSGGVVQMVFCNIDYLTILESYDFEVIEWNWAVHWAWKLQREIRRFIIKNNDEKVTNKKLAGKESDPVKKQEYLTKSNRAKINNNAFYGKFGEEIEKRGKTPYLEGGDVVYKCDRYEVMTEHKRRFLPLAIAVTAWGRNQLVTMCNTLGEYFLYCDTDSVHFLKEGGQERVTQAARAGQFETDETKLGSWKHEGNFHFGRYLRAKCYMEKNPAEKPEVTCAGLPADKHSGRGSKQRSCCTAENFHIGLYIPGGNGKLRTVRTPTGNKLVPTDFQITEHYSLFGTGRKPTEETIFERMIAEGKKDFRRAVMSLGGVNDTDYESLPRWCKRKSGYTLGELIGELSEMGYWFEDANHLFEEIQKN